MVDFESVLLVNNLPGSHAFAHSLQFLGQKRNTGKTLQVRERLVDKRGLPCLPIGSIASFFVHFRRSNGAHLLGECLLPVRLRGVAAAFCASAFEISRCSMAFSCFASL